jgi:hypothetical protein
MLTRPASSNRSDDPPALRAMLRKQQGPGVGNDRTDHQRWPDLTDHLTN